MVSLAGSTKVRVAQAARGNRHLLYYLYQLLSEREKEKEKDGKISCLLQHCDNLAWAIFLVLKYFDPVKVLEIYVEETDV